MNERLPFGIPKCGPLVIDRHVNIFVDGDSLVFHSINRWGKNQILGDIRSQIPKKLPAFMHVFLHNWTYKYDDIHRLVSALPPNVVVVRPDELALLYRQHVSEKKR